MRSGEAAAGPSRPALLALVLGLLALHLLLAAVLPLTEDEAYYRLWSMAPAAGYYDHPPMIAWLIGAGRALVGDTPLGVRLFPCIGCALTAALTWDAARSLGLGEGVAARAALWWNATILACAGGLLAVPDAPASLFWTASLACLARTVRSPRWWIAAGLCAGLAALSKYSALFLGPGVFLWLACRRDRQAMLARPWPWLALALAAGLFSINVAWNAAHHWTTFAKQFGRIAPHRFDPKYVAELIVGQALLLGPLLALTLARGGRRPWRAAPLLLWTSLPFAAYLVIHALHDRVQANWPAPLYPGLAILAALAAEGCSARWRRRVPATGFALAALAGALLLLPAAGVPLPLDPGRPLRDWSGFSRKVEALRRSAGAAWIGATSYGLTSQLLDQRAIGAPVVQIAERDRWRGLAVPAADLSRPGLVIDLTRRVDPRRLQACFAQVRPLGDIRRAAPGERGALYAAFEVAHPRKPIQTTGC